MSTPLYVRAPRPTHPYFSLGAALVIVGFVLLGLGLEALAQCASGALASCSVLVYALTRGLGTAFVFVGFVLMLLIRKPVTPLAVLLPKA
jgi:hypothetical protein